MKERFRQVIGTDAPTAVILVWLAVGWVFLSEGIQKFLFPDALWVPGRFLKIGIPYGQRSCIVGVIELAGGALILLGIFTRPAALALAFDMLVAFTSTKIRMCCSAKDSGVLPRSAAGRRDSGPWRTRAEPTWPCCSGHCFFSWLVPANPLWTRASRRASSPEVRRWMRIPYRRSPARVRT